MDMAIDFTLEHNGPLNAPSEIFERTNDVHTSADTNADPGWNLDKGWDCFPGLLPA